MCDCGCGGCSPTKPVMLNESLAPKEILSEGLKYHMDNNMPLTEHVYRAGSQKYFELWAEARALYARNILEVQGDDLEVLNETDLGHFGTIYEIEIGDKVKASKEYGGLSGEVVDVKGSFVVVKTKKGTKSYHESDLQVLNKEGIKVPLDFIMELTEGEINEEAKKKLNKPMRDSSGGKAYKVYVKDPKTKKIKTVRFGSGGLRAKINDKEARNAFAKRHKCSTKKDKTKAGYWSCRLPRYAKLLGLKSNFGGFW